MSKKIIYLVGLPCSGKSTWRRRNHTGAALGGLNEVVHKPFGVVISNDLVTQAYADTNKITYNDAFSILCKTDIVKKTCREIFDNAVKTDIPIIIIDNTNMTVKARRLYEASGYEKHCVIFECSDEELQNRNEIRKLEGKFIPATVFDQMKSIYTEPSEAEGFVTITKVEV